MQTQSNPCAAGETLAAQPLAGGDSIGAGDETDVSTGHAVCARSELGLIEPESPPALTPPKTAREFEQVLRSLGYSKRQARAICAGGFKAAMQQTDEPEDVTEILGALRRACDTINERFVV